LIEFQLQNFYLIYTWLIGYAILNLAYPKEYIYYMLLIYNMTLLFQNILCSSVTHDYVTMTWDYIMWQFVIVTYNITLTSNLKSENKKIKIKESRNEKRMKINRVYYLQLWQWPICDGGRLWEKLLQLRDLNIQWEIAETREL